MKLNGRMNIEDFFYDEETNAQVIELAFYDQNWDMPNRVFLSFMNDVIVHEEWMCDHAYENHTMEETINTHKEDIQSIHDSLVNLANGEYQNPISDEEMDEDEMRIKLSFRYRNHPSKILFYLWKDYTREDDGDDFLKKQLDARGEIFGVQHHENMAEILHCFFTHSKNRLRLLPYKESMLELTDHKHIIKHKKTFTPQEEKTFVHAMYAYQAFVSGNISEEEYDEFIFDLLDEQVYIKNKLNKENVSEIVLYTRKDYHVAIHHFMELIKETKYQFSYAKKWKLNLPG